MQQAALTVEDREEELLKQTSAVGVLCPVAGSYRASLARRLRLQSHQPAACMARHVLTGGRWRIAGGATPGTHRSRLGS